MSIYRRRRGMPFGLAANFNAAAYYNDDAGTSSYFFDDGFTQPYNPSD